MYSEAFVSEYMKAINIPQFKPETDNEIEMWKAAQKARDAMR